MKKVKMGEFTYTKGKEDFSSKKMAIKEYKILDWLKESGLNVPKPIYFDTRSLFLTMSLVPEHHIQKDDKKLEKLIKIIGGLHSLKVPRGIKRFLPTYLEEGGAYARILGLNKEFYAQMKYMKKRSKSLVHNDLVESNILEHNEIGLIDFGQSIYGIGQTDLVRLLFTFDKLNTPEENDIVDFYKNLNFSEEFNELYKIAKKYQFIKFAAGCTKFLEDGKVKGQDEKKIKELINLYLKLGGING